MTKDQARMTEFMLKYDGWQSFASDRQTVECVCALSNLGIIQVNKFQQMRLKSRAKALALLGA